VVIKRRIEWLRDPDQGIETVFFIVKWKLRNSQRGLPGINTDRGKLQGISRIDYERRKQNRTLETRDLY
jgi:hypothetical protein